MRNLVLEPLALELSVCKFPPDMLLDDGFVNKGGFLNVTRTEEELSVVCDQTAAAALNPAQVQSGWKAFKVKGPLDFSLTAILSAIAAPLAAEKISIFAISTFDTDYVLVPGKDFEKAGAVLKEHFTLA